MHFSFAMRRFASKSFLAACILLLPAPHLAADEGDPLRTQLKSIVLDRMQCDRVPLSQVVAELSPRLNTQSSQPLVLKLELDHEDPEPLITCSLQNENADTVLEFITLQSGFMWRIENNTVAISTSPVHQARWRRGERISQREALRKLKLPRMEFVDRPLAEIFLALGRMATEQGLERLEEGLPALAFVQKFVENPEQGPRVTVIFDGCTLDDALELLTCRVRGFQWSIYQGAVVSYIKPWQE